MAQRKTTTTYTHMSFWPKVYAPNIKRYPDLVKEYGSPSSVMKAEKRWLWNALDYTTKCSILETKGECKRSYETRHKDESLKNEYYHKRAQYKICNYNNKSKKCKALLPNDELPLQFLRWILHEVNAIGFKEYVAAFPHQLTEENYGYSAEDKVQYIPSKVVEELKEEILEDSKKKVTSMNIGCKRQLKHTQKQLKDIKQRNAFLHYNLSRANKQNEDLLTEINTLRARAKDLVSKLREMKSRGQFVQPQKRTSESAKKLHQEITVIRKTKQQLENVVDEQKSLITSFQAETKQDLTKLKELNQQVNVLSKNIKSLESELDDAKKEYEQLTNTYLESKATSSKTIHNLQEQLEQVTESHQNIETEVARIYNDMTVDVYNILNKRKGQIQNFEEIKQTLTNLKNNIENKNLSINKKIESLYSSFHILYNRLL